MEAMLLDLSELRKDVKVRLTAFSNMYHLRFLRFHYGFFFQWEKYFGWAPYKKMYLPSEANLWSYLGMKTRIYNLELYNSPDIVGHASPLYKDQNILMKITTNLEDVQNISSSMDITELKLVGTGIKTLPESIWKMRFLKYLNLHDCPKLEKLQEISDDCMSSSLQMLNIRGCARLKSIPKSIWKMSSLRDLNLYDCPNLEILPEISDDCMSSSLERLNISDCTRLKSIPESIWKMSSLTYLSLYDCPNLEKLQEISDDCMSSSLEWSDIRDCTRLCGPINLRWISLSTSLVRVPTWFKNLNKLEQLDLDYSDVKLNLKYLFGEEWSSVCSNVTEASFRASIHGVGDVVVDWEIKKFGLGLANKWGIAIKSKRRFSECRGQPDGYQDKVDSHDPYISSKRIKGPINN
ncbi:hypothetical protein FEM48_Zijuj05G0138100 [Ziziphus jujuba var. spinosa]|uniref:Uncharacterized protein n=1 Tax=Ziziphus jujuba var. spinosa TaxID=714518 RepID=A0A978VF69_ZIZJJ|nr:hypothetical protein FEM48_Zijuj05G0138100 [Ziziphus jujuba var. spinosa]